MTKAELITILTESLLPDDAPIYVWTDQCEPIELEIHEGASGTFADGFVVITEEKP